MVLTVGMGGAKGRKIVRPPENGECLDHSRQIERLPDEPGVVSPQGRTNRPVADPVEVHLAHCIKAGMEGERHLANLPNDDIRREEAVDPHQEAPLAEKGGGMKIRNLAEGVHPRVRAAGTDDADLLAGHPADAFLDDLLDGEAVGLMLPSAIGAAVILDDQLDISHCRIRFQSFRTEKRGKPLSPL